MIAARIVAPEALDGLAEDNPAAMRSRRDLQRLHRVMGTRSIIVRALREIDASRQESPRPLRVLELGAGDGSLMLEVARALGPAWSNVELTLLDRQDLVDASTFARYAELGWTAITEIIDVFDWAARGNTAPIDNATTSWDLIVANLFLHHFEGAELAAVLSAAAASSKCFFACEPRRAWLALAGSRLIGVIGVNAVTRGDAVLSVRAGFRDKELTKLWPIRSREWKLGEYPAGLFSHCFRAQRIE